MVIFEMSALVSNLVNGPDMNEYHENLKRQCRICLSEATELNMDCIFELLHDGFSIADILEEVSNIKVEKDSHITNLICKVCTKIIFDFRYLVKTFYDTEEYLRTCLSKSEEITIEKEQIAEERLQESNNHSSDDLLFNKDDSGSSDSDNDEPFHQNDEIDPDDTPLSSLITKNSTNSQNLGNKIGEEPITTGVNVRHNGRNSSTDISDIKVFDNQSETQEVPSIKYTCEICGDCFLFKSGFGHHMLMVHNICIQVNQYEQYSSQITIKVPKGIPDNETKYVRRFNPPIPLYKTEVQCKKCKEMFKTIEALKKHNEVHKTFRCEQCGAAFIKNSYLRDHLLKHSADKCYSCKDCGQAFKYRSALAVHRREHVGTNTGHMCETCGRNFKERGTLKTHIMLKHTNERNFPCSGCDLTFKLKAARDKHYMRKHTFNRTKDFVCSMCGMAYLNKETLTRHMTDKHTGTPSFHWCTVCQKSFTMKSNLSKHLRNKHNVIIKKEQC